MDHETQVGSQVASRRRRLALLAFSSVAIASCGGGGEGGPDTAPTPAINRVSATSGISGPLSHGESITLGGSGFGTKDHAGPMLWDDFDAGTNGSAVAGPSGGTQPLIHQGNLSGYDQWIREGGGDYLDKSVAFDNSAPKANSSLHARATFIDSTYWGLNLYIPYSNFTTGKELYISFYYRMTKTGAAFPRQTKAWVAYNAGGFDRLYWSTAYDNCESGSYRAHIAQVGPREEYFGTDGVDIDGEWVRFETYLKQSGPDAANGTWQQALHRPSRLASPQIEFHGMFDQKLRTDADDFVNWTFGGAYYEAACPNGGNPGTVDVDEFYMDHTLARVEVCDAPTWSASTRCELQVSTSWSDASITATFNKGYLAPSQPAYIYVINAAGNVNAAGFPITVAP